MPTRESLKTVGERRNRLLRTRAAGELVSARLEAGISRRRLAELLGIDRERLAGAERGDASALTVDIVARAGVVLGRQAAISLYPDGTPGRDQARLNLLKRSWVRLPASIPIRDEVSMPIPGDRRSGDAVISPGGEGVLVEADTHLYDVQALERRVLAKARDRGAQRVILLVADTAHNRRVIREAEPRRATFPLATRVALAALARSEPPAANAIVIL